MKNPAKEVYRAVVPDYEDLWERGDAKFEKVEVDNKRYENVPFFNTEITDSEVAQIGNVHSVGGARIGGFEAYSVRTSDGVDRTARVYTPDDPYRSDSDLVVHADTAWLTTITGHNHHVMSEIMQKTGLPVVIVGAEHGTNGLGFPADALRLPRTIKRSTKISLAKSAECSQLITGHLLDEYDLPRDIINIGESRGAMLAPGHYPYAEAHGNRIVYADTTAPCMPDKLLSDWSDVARLATWPSREMLGAIIVGLEAKSQQVLSRQLGTVALNPNFNVSNLIGVGPALFSGEAGQFTKWVPRQAGIHIATFDNDTLSRPDRWKELYKDHPNVSIITLRGSHITLAHGDVLRHIVERINKFKEEYAHAEGDLAEINWNNVHLKDDDAHHSVAA